MKIENLFSNLRLDAYYKAAFLASIIFLLVSYIFPLVDANTYLLREVCAIGIVGSLLAWMLEDHLNRRARLLLKTGHPYQAQHLQRKRVLYQVIAWSLAIIIVVSIAISLT